MKQETTAEKFSTSLSLCFVVVVCWLLSLLYFAYFSSSNACARILLVCMQIYKYFRNCEFTHTLPLPLFSMYCMCSACVSRYSILYGCTVSHSSFFFWFALFWFWFGSRNKFTTSPVYKITAACAMAWCIYGPIDTHRKNIIYYIKQKRTAIDYVDGDDDVWWAL